MKTLIKLLILRLLRLDKQTLLIMFTIVHLHDLFNVGLVADAAVQCICINVTYNTERSVL